MDAFDADSVTRALAPLTRAAKTAFAASCAERLWPTYVRYARVNGQAVPGHLQTVLDDVWHVIETKEARLSADTEQRIQNDIPDEDETVLDVGYGQGAMLCLAYTVRTWLSNDSQNAAWAARQVYDVADYGASFSLPVLALNEPDVAARLQSSAPLRRAISGVEADLEYVTNPSSSWTALRRRAHEEGRNWNTMLPSPYR